MSNADELLNLYNEIDHFLRREGKKDKDADHAFLILELSTVNPTVARNQQLLRAVAQVRNNLVHNPIPSVAQPLVDPNPRLVEMYRDVRDTLLNPPKALSIAIPGQDIYTTTLSAKLSAVMQAMDDHVFTHVPVLDNDDRMIGVFSENSLLSYLADNGEGIITKDMKIEDIREFLPLKAHRGESFVFVSRNTPLSKIYEIFNEAIQVRQRIGMVFVTQNGRESEKLLGIITAWDLASPEFQF